jgi:hypothetical protein
LGQVVEADGDFGMVGPEAGFIDGQRTAHQRFGVPNAACPDVGGRFWRKRIEKPDGPLELARALLLGQRILFDRLEQTVRRDLDTGKDRAVGVEKGCIDAHGWP